MRKKVLIVNNYFTVRGGNDSAFIGMTNFLAKSGLYDVYVLTSRDLSVSESLESSPFDHTVKVFFVKLARFKSLRSVFSSFFNLRVFIQYWRIDRLYKFDELIIHTVTSHLTYSFLLAVDRTRTRVAMVNHDYYQVCAKRTLFDKGNICLACLSSGNRLYSVINQCEKSWLLSVYKYLDYIWNFKILTLPERIDTEIYVSRFAQSLLPRKGLLIRNIIDANHIPRRRIFNPDDFVVGFIGRMAEEKGLNLMMELFSRNAQINFVLATKDILKIEVGANVTVLNDIDRSNLSIFFNQIDFLLVPSIWFENMPMVIVEAFSFGIPCIVNPVGGVSELVENGRTGFYLDELGDDLSVLRNVDFYKMSNFCRDSFLDFKKSAAIDLINYLNE